MQSQLAPMPLSTRRSNNGSSAVPIIGAIVAFVIINVIWAAIAAISEILPSHLEVLKAYPDLLSGEGGGETLVEMTISSISNFLIALLLGAIVGVSLGLASGSHPAARAVIDPLSAFMRIAAFIGLPQLLLLTRGLTRSLQIIPPAIVIATTLALAFGNAHGAGRSTIVTLGVRSAIAIGWGSLMLVEATSSPTGLASGVFRQQAFFQIENLVAISLVAIAIALIMDLMARAAGHLASKN